MVETSVVGCSLLGYICFEQLNNFIIEYMYSSSYDVKYIFKYWFLFHVAEMILFLFLKNIWIIRSANLNFPEFNGLTGAKFPGQEAPRPILYGIFFIDRYTVLETLKFQSYTNKALLTICIYMSISEFPRDCKNTVLIGPNKVRKIYVTSPSTDSSKSDVKINIR